MATKAGAAFRRAKAISIAQNVKAVPDPRRCSIRDCPKHAFYRVGKLGFCEGHKEAARAAARAALK